MLSFLEAPKGVLKRWDYHRARMLWQESDDRKMYHLVSWQSICQQILKSWHSAPEDYESNPALQMVVEVGKH